MRDLLERLPGALMPDPRHESDDPGVQLAPLSPTPLVAPLQTVMSHHAADSPLLQHLRLHVPPFDARCIGLALGFRLQLAGATIVHADIETGHLQRHIGRHCRGQSIPDAAHTWMQVSPFGGLAATVAVVRAAERILALGVESPSLVAARRSSLWFAAVGHHLEVLASSVFAWSSANERSLRRLRDDVARTLAGLMVGAPLAQPYALTRPLDGELQAMSRLAHDAARVMTQVPSAIRAWSGIGVVTSPSRGLVRSAPLLGPIGSSLVGVLSETTVSCTMSRLWHRWHTVLSLCRLIQQPSPPSSAPTVSIVRRQHRLGCGQAEASNGMLTAVLMLDDRGLVDGVSIHAADRGLLPLLSRALAHTNLEDAVAVMQSFGVDVGLVDA
jgi:hypothetical protein